ncbi:MAG TPA: tetratricopeptide repeat protein [Lysobacter sp.]|nr:tetratricopeptide repeat protein [Lysobacter sp.]
MKNPMLSKRILVATMGAAFVAMIGAASAAPIGEPAGAPQARSGSKSPERASRSNKKAEAPAAANYPDATRKEPKLKASERISRKLSKMMDLYEEENGAEARAMADEIIADPKANGYEKAYSAQLAAQVAYEAEDATAAIDYFKKVIEFDGLDNNAHYNIMLNLAQLQQQEEQYAESQATFDRFFSETGNKDPINLMMKGQGLYLMQRYDEAAAVMKQAIEASADPKPDWMALLMQTYAEAGNTTEAVRVAEQVAASKPDDKRAQLNLAAVYSQADLPDKALAVMEKLRAGNQLDTANEYKVLYTTYSGIEGREKDVIAVINEGLQKGALEPDYNTYVALAQAYYFSDQPAQAITAYQKAAPLAKDGEAYLNLARVLQQENRIPEAKAAARQALAKGIKKAKDANVIIALPGN